MAERRVAQAVLEHPHLVAFGTVADLAAEAGAGAATVVRLAAKLGFDGFSCAAVVGAGRSCPAIAPGRRTDPRACRPPARRAAPGERRCQRHRDDRQRSTATPSTRWSPLLSDLQPAGPRARRRGRARRGAAVRPRPRRAARRRERGGRQRRRGAAAARPQPRRARRSSSSTCAVTNAGCSTPWRSPATLGHTIIACTDGPLSPLATRPRYSFTLAARSDSPFDSHVGTLALLELIVAAVAERLRTSATSRLERVESAWAAARCAHRRVSSARTPSRRTGRFRSRRSSNPIAARATTAGSWVGAASLVTRVGV